MFFSFLFYPIEHESLRDSLFRREELSLPNNSNRALYSKLTTDQWQENGPKEGNDRQYKSRSRYFQPRIHPWMSSISILPFSFFSRFAILMQFLSPTLLSLICLPYSLLPSCPLNLSENLFNRVKLSPSHPPGIYLVNLMDGGEMKFGRWGEEGAGRWGGGGGGVLALVFPFVCKKEKNSREDKSY